MVLMIGVFMMIWGAYIMVKGEVSFSKKKTVTGGKARIVGVLIASSLPVGAAIFFGTLALGMETKDEGMWLTVLIFAPYVCLPMLAIVLGSVWAKNPRLRANRSDA